MRLSLAIEAGLLTAGPAVFLHPPAGLDLCGMDATVVHPLKPIHDAWARRVGAEQVMPTMPKGRFALAHVTATRSKAQSLGLIATAAAQADVIAVDGQKTDGIDSLMGQVKRHTPLLGLVNKGHGRIFWFATCDLSNWAMQPKTFDGVTTYPGVFAHGGVDAGTQVLTQHLPPRMTGHIGDLGAGWGALARAVLARGAGEVTAVEADHTALHCGAASLLGKVHWLWEDVTHHHGRYDAVVMNPPFHEGRTGTPQLGQAFIAAAARSLKPDGTLWMVANRHLPYERTLDPTFRTSD